MGCFDTVIFKCPECGAKLEEQSKGGKCCMGEFPASAVPFGVADDLLGKVIVCNECCTEWAIETMYHEKVPLMLKPVTVTKW